MGTDVDANNPARTPRKPASGTLLRVLTHTQNASALAFSVFMGIHLAAPLAAAFGATQAADNVMLVGREYYHFLEPVAVYAPLGLHLASSLAKRALLAYRTGRFRTTTHTVLGYVLIPLVVPHLMLHRLIPATEGPPINSLSPSEMGYEFVGYACGTRKWMTAGYVLLTGVALWHGVIGLGKAIQWAKGLGGRADREGGSRKEADSKMDANASEKKRSKLPASQAEKQRATRSLITTITMAVCVGLVRLTADAQGLSSLAASRYDAVFAAAPWASIGFR
ncbi:hypothetical protein CspeluHIS016_0801940 [Cutaneotrichosporon spelunceum]|uniref:Mitochondrial adapter protein MCP1 transmembrane domain-containing protein n=1 Tax=Cutaneotrichosporon spelunceum TaxID=1672016 RepID=A0AAD3YEX6_9TREE|nr:hypothetical protein CspeluHIS016_0801940 [Cutaneotrichosporon spelunceum]